MDDAVLNDVFMTLVVMTATATLGLAQIRNLPANERLIPQLSLLAHMLTGPALLAIMDYVFKQSDVHYYFTSGSNLARLMRLDFFNWAPEVLKLILQQPNQLAVYFPDEYGGAYATSSMTGTVGVLMLLLNDAQYAAFAFMAGLAFFGRLAAYRGARLLLPAMPATSVAVAMMIIPSVVFWSSGVVKESWASTGLGLFTLWLARVSAGSILSSPHLLVLALLPIALIKPYLLFPLTLASGTWFLMRRQRELHATVKPLNALVAVVAVMALMAVLSTAFPQFSLAEFGNSAATMQQYGARTGGGSNYSIGNSEATTLSGQLMFAPIALTTVLIRPFVFEVRSFSMFLASLEATILFYLLVQLFRRNSVESVLTMVRRSPPIAFCLVFTVVSGLAIGLATSNFGTLSRYRIPMMPYYVLLVLALVDKSSGVAATVRPRATSEAPHRIHAH